MNSRYCLSLVIGLAWLTATGPLHANPGEDGNQVFVASGTPQVINAYASLNATASIGATSLSVQRSAISALALPAAACPSGGCSLPLQAGDLLMIYQPQGADMTTADTTSYGDVSNYRSAGLYEFVYVTGPVPSTGGDQSATVQINFSTNASGVPCTGLRNSYEVRSLAGVAPPMLIRVPQYRNLTVPAGATLAAAPWNGTLGGVLVADVRDNTAGGGGLVTLNGLLTASGRGFRGGTDISTQSDTDNNSSAGYRNAPGSSQPSADKGESIVGSITRYDALNGRAGRGAPANGGGGGSGHNGAGGGGSNAGSPAPGNSNSYGGSLGVPSVTGSADPGGSGSGYFQAWCLDQAIGNGTTSCAALNSGSGGGRGGYTWGQNWAPSPFTVAPGDAAWGGSDSNRRNLGGLGGRPLNADATSAQRGQTYRRLFFGGGGGAGDSNNGGGTGSGWAGTGCGATGGSDPGAPPANGGNGGGLVFLISNRVEGSGAARADGNAGDPACGVSGEGTAGGGGGGSVVISTSSAIRTLPPALAVSAAGGAGGIQTNAATGRGLNCTTDTSGTACESQGGGGGGGGGVVLAPSGGNKSVAGGNYGYTLATSMQGIISGSSSGRFYPNGATSGALGFSGLPPPRSGGPFTCLDGPGFSTPVTLAHVAVRSAGDRLTVSFATAAEVGHAGFEVEALDAAGQRLALSEFLPSPSAGGDAGAGYSVTLAAPAATRVRLIEIDALGRRQTHGPFAVGEDFGALPPPQELDWQPARADLARQRQALRQAGAQQALIEVAQPGMQLVTAQALADAGVMLDGVPLDELALIGLDGPVSFEALGAEAWNSASSLRFHARPAPSLWSRNSHFLLRRDASQSRRITPEALTVAWAGGSTHAVVLEHAPQAGYDPASPIGDPWYARRIVAQGGSSVHVVSLDGPAPLDGQARLSLALWGGIDYPGDGPDHHVRILANGQAIAEARWNGISAQLLDLELDALSLPLQVQVEVIADSGNPIDIVYLESVRLQYRSALQAASLPLSAGQLDSTPSETIFADGAGDAVSFLHGSIGLRDVPPGSSVYAIDGPSLRRLNSAPVAGNVALDARDLTDQTRLWAGPDAALVAPGIRAAAAEVALDGGAAEWLLIGPAVMLPAAEPLRAHRAAQGLSTRLVDVEAIYSRYSAGNPTPQAIAAYLRDMAGPSGTRYVLLLGGDSVDAPGHLQSGAVSWVPTPYRPTSLFVAYAPADAALGDIDGDGVAELAVGRLPARTLDEAAAMVAKILAYETSSPASDDVVLVSGPDDGAVDFAADSLLLDQALPPDWSRRYVRQSIEGLQQARLRLVEAFDDAPGVLAYMGHSGPTRWSFDPLFTTSQVLGTHPDPLLNLSATAAQPLVLQFACWTTYFVSAQQNSMAQTLLASPDRGASSVFGATVLMAQQHHRLMSAALGAELRAGVRIGDAVLAAKQALAESEAGSHPEIQSAQVLLGDPATRLPRR